MLNDQIAEFAHGPMTPVAGEDDVGVGEGGGVGIGGDHAAAGGLEAADIVFVVADEYDVFGFNLMLLAPVLEGVVFTAL